MKIGIIYCGFNTQDYIDKSLSVWVEAREKKIGNNEYFISAISYPFLKFPSEVTDNTQKILSTYKENNLIDSLLTDDVAILETEARTRALKELMRHDIEAIIQVDSDEFWTLDEIRTVFNFTKDNSFITFFKVCYKNYVFSDKQYLAEPFTPSRIHRIKYLDNTAIGFWDDNNIYYVNKNGKIIKDIELSSLVIPKNLVWVKHLTWLSDERSHKKVLYQQARGWTCSFAWDDSLGLIWNKKSLGQNEKNIPEILQDS